jgi:hypothetical protein
MTNGDTFRILMNILVRRVIKRLLELMMMWKSCVMGKHYFFFWLLLRDRLNTRELLKRKIWRIIIVFYAGTMWRKA